MRKILQASRNSFANCNPFSHQYQHARAYRDRDINTHLNGNAHANGHSYPDRNSMLSPVTPENGATLKPLGRVTFSWEAMSGAVDYKLEIILPTNQPVIFETPKTSRDQYIEAIAMGGVFRWQVTALDANSSIICSTEQFIFTKPEYIPPAPTPTRTIESGDTTGGGPGSSTSGSGSSAGATGSWSGWSDV